MAAPAASSPFVSRFKRTVLLDAAFKEAGISIDTPYAPLEAVSECSARLQTSRKSGPVYVHELLQGSELIVEAPVIPPKSPEYLAWKAAAEARYAQIQYNKMVANVTADHSQNEEPLQLSSFRSQASLAANHIITLATCFVACYYLGTRYNNDTGFALVCGTIGGVGGLIVEVLLFIIKGSQLDATSEQMRKRASSRKTRGSERAAQELLAEAEASMAAQARSDGTPPVTLDSKEK